MFAISYCQMSSFYPALNLDKIVIFRSSQQKEEEIYRLEIFSQGHVPYFDHVTFRQWKYAAATVLNREKSTSLAELFAIELKFTTDTLIKWFNDIFKPEFREVSEIQKQLFTKGNSIDWLTTKCSICDLK